MSNDIETGFGLAPIKQEGMCFSIDYPNLVWKPYNEEFDVYFNDKYRKWYFKPLRRILRKIAKHSWNMALFENAKNKGDPNAR